MKEPSQLFAIEDFSIAYKLKHHSCPMSIGKIFKFFPLHSSQVIFFIGGQGAIWHIREKAGACGTKVINKEICIIILFA